MATKNIIPRNNDEGQIGSSSKKWASAFISDGTFDTLSVAGQAVSGGGATALTELSDVTISNVQNNQVLKYNGSNWTNAAAPATLSDTDDLSEGSSNLYFTNERVDDRVNALTTAGIGIAKSYNDTTNTLTLTLDLDELSAAAVDVANDSIVIIDANDSNGSKKESISDLITAVAGNGLSGSSGVLDVGVDDVSIEIDSDVLRVKALGIANTMLAGSIADTKLNTISTPGKVTLSALDINGENDIGADLSDADLLIVDNGANGTNRKAALSRVKSYIETNASVSSVTDTITVTVVNSGGNKYALDGVTQKVGVLSKGFKYKFDQSDATNGGHPLRFSTTLDGTHNSGSAYLTNVTVSGTPGNSGAYTLIDLTQETPGTLYYYCTAHAGMGASVQTEGVVPGNGLNKSGMSLSVDSTIITGQIAESAADDNDLILISDTSDSGTLKKMTRATFAAGLGGGGSSTTLQPTVTTSTPSFSAATSGTHIWLLNGSTITVVLPSSGITNGTIYHLKNVNSTTATVSGTIDNLSSKSLSQYDNLTVVATGSGSQWYII
jgi:plastocyanin